MRQRLRGEAGDAVVEFVLLTPILLLMLFGIFELGRVLDTWLVLHNAAREGARAGAAARSSAEASTAAQQFAERSLDTGIGGRTDVAATLIEPPVVTADAVQVAATAQVELYTPFLQGLLAARVPVRATATMRRQ